MSFFQLFKPALFKVMFVSASSLFFPSPFAVVLLRYSAVGQWNSGVKPSSPYHLIDIENL